MNDSRRYDPRQDACDELAERLATDDGLRLARLMQGVEGLIAAAEPVASGDGSDDPKTAPQPISIWRPRRDPDTDQWIFERPEPHPLGDHYAARRTFALDKDPGTLRICFFGESAAAGYLYAPHLTPAQVLETRLRQLVGHDRVEVIDLARTNERLDSWVRTVEASRPLAADAWVFFTGNNWNLLETPELSPWAPRLRDRQLYASALRRGGFEGPVELARRRLARRVDMAFDHLARLAAEDETQVVLVVPEVDLGSWEVAQPVPWLPGGGARRWHELLDEALRHLPWADTTEVPDTDGLDTAEHCARSMQVLEGGEHPTAHRLLARVHRARGHLDAARQASEDAVEHAAYPRVAMLDSPRAGESVKNLLRRVATRHQFTTVDLPWVFAAEGSTLPSSDPRDVDPPGGEPHFVDYCHLSAHGMDVAMGAAAQAVLDALDQEIQIDPGTCPKLGVDPAVEALASVGAALHGAHRHLGLDGIAGNPSTPFRAWLERALDRSPAIVDTLVDLLAARVAAVPAVLTEAQQRQLASRHRLLLQHGWRWEHLDAPLLRTLFELLEPVVPDTCQDLRQRLLTHHGVGPKPRDLSRAPYLWQPLDRAYPEVMPETEASRRATVRALWPRTGFCLVADGTCPVLLDLVLRLPSIEGWPEERAGDVGLSIDGVPWVHLRVEGTWTRHRVRIPAHLLANVLHRLTLQWPPLPDAGDDALATAVDRLELGREADLFPVFGEVASCVAQAP